MVASLFHVYIAEDGALVNAFLSSLVDAEIVRESARIEEHLRVFCALHKARESKRAMRPPHKHVGLRSFLDGRRHFMHAAVVWRYQDCQSRMAG